MGCSWTNKLVLNHFLELKTIAYNNDLMQAYRFAIYYDLEGNTLIPHTVPR